MTVHTLYTFDDVHFGNLIIHILQFILCNVARYFPIYTSY